MCYRLINPGCIQRENRWTIRKWIFVIFLLILFVSFILHFVHQSFHYCSGPFGDSSHLNLNWHVNYDKFMNRKCSKGFEGQNSEQIENLSFIARIVLNIEGQITAICAGTLIFDDIVVTAAHCLIKRNYSSLEVHLGTPSNTEIFTKFTENDIKIHENYDSFNNLNDIAIIKLKRSLNSSSTTSTLCIPFDGKKTPKNLSMGEWNVDEIIVSYPEIKEINVNGIDNVQCGHEFLNFVQVRQSRTAGDQIPEIQPEIGKNLKEIRFEQFCADKKSVKSGNSGMPVYGYDLKTGAPTIYGLVSYGVKVELGVAAPTVFTKIYDYRHWILCHAY